MNKYDWQLLDKTLLTRENIVDLKRILLRNRSISLKEEAGFFRPRRPQTFTLDDLGVDKQEAEKSFARLDEARRRHEKVVVVGDYDVDGFSSTALVWENFYRHGWDILPFIPHRLRDGYGLRSKMVRNLKEKHKNLKLLITVDNGISAFEAVKEANKLGIDVIVVDHHLRLEKRKLPAVATIHSEMVSAGALSWFWLRHWFEPDLGLAALSTISDVMPLRGVNRSLVVFGLPVLAATRRVGLRQLFNRAGVHVPLDTYKVGFMIAPRLNALGRIAEPLDALRLLCTRRLARGSQLAELANKINSQRQQMVSAGLELAKQRLGKKRAKILLVADESYHRGIVGLIASRLVEEFARPALVIQKEGEVAHGSARSVDGVDITHLLTQLKTFLIEVGGHAKAAGFSLATKDLPLFRESLEKLAEKKVDKKLLRLRKKVDCQLTAEVVDRQLYEAVAQMAPFGEANRQPSFLLAGMRVAAVRTVGQNDKHLKLTLFDPRLDIPRRRLFEAIGFNFGNLAADVLEGDVLDIVFTPQLNYWNGQEKLVLHLRDLKLQS